MDYVWWGAGLLVLAVSTYVLSRAARVPLGWLPVTALLRAVVQLAVVAAILRGVLAVPWTVALFVVLMLSTASWTAGSRLVELPRGHAIALTGVLAGAAVTLVLVFALRLVDLEARYVVAVAGIIIGNAMSASTLSGRNFMRAARARRDEVEAWLSLGATPVQAYDDIGRDAAREALLPNLDQTRSTGLVTLPGAFVGALFGGASPVVAAQFQLVVLAGIALTMLTTAIVVTRLAGRSPYVVPDVVA
ncbi:putative ABC transport system permease protein [Nocardioides exalbidus]|uniref:Putative ABC transport system permease protein n=1 Tax=Nocardioides exalbidus TaxID=402596 RepID=A0A1H4MZZ9_9ACTN|nr:ABC transporter permease [Nocardioides exalbidus]SEB88397.1 putative ABC transport system permease protein [Nocardioides exalbidus]